MYNFHIFSPPRAYCLGLILDISRKCVCAFGGGVGRVDLKQRLDST